MKDVIKTRRYYDEESGIYWKYNCGWVPERIPHPYRMVSFGIQDLRMPLTIMEFIEEFGVIPCKN